MCEIQEGRAGSLWPRPPYFDCLLFHSFRSLCIDMISVFQHTLAQTPLLSIYHNINYFKGWNNEPLCIIYNMYIITTFSVLIINNQHIYLWYKIYPKAMKVEEGMMLILHLNPLFLGSEYYKLLQNTPKA